MYMMFWTRHNDGVMYRYTSFMYVFQINISNMCCWSAVCRILFCIQDVLPSSKLVLWYCPLSSWLLWGTNMKIGWTVICFFLRNGDFRLLDIELLDVQKWIPCFYNGLCCILVFFFMFLSMVVLVVFSLSHNVQVKYISCWWTIRKQWFESRVSKCINMLQHFIFTADISLITLYCEETSSQSVQLPN
jgi:hypothetical protein